MDIELIIRNVDFVFVKGKLNALLHCNIYVPIIGVETPESHGQLNRDSIISNAHREENSIVSSAKEYYKSTTQKANDDADSIIKRAQAQAEEMVASHSITQAARVRAEEIKDNCQKEMNAFIAKTNADCDAHKKAARDWAASTSQGSYNFVCEALSKYQNIAMNNLNQITEVYKQFQSGYENHMRTLGEDKTVSDEPAE